MLAIMRRVQLRLLPPAFFALCAAACASASAPSTTPAPVSGPPPAVTARPSPAAPAAPLPSRALPGVPRIDGPLSIRVVYPTAGQVIAAHDSNFIFGSVGNGDATLLINGNPVPVYPNGAFLAFLPVPGGQHPEYELIATRGVERAASVVAIGFVPPSIALPDTGRLVVDRASAVPAGRLARRADERVRVAVRAPQNATVTFSNAAGARRALRARGVAWSGEVAARDLDRGAALVVRRGADSVRVPLAAAALADAAPPRFARLRLREGNVAAVNDTDAVVIARPRPLGTYKWFLLPGTTVEVTGRTDQSVRVRLDSQLEVWLDDDMLELLPEEADSPRRTAANARAVEGDRFTDVRIPVTSRPPYFVEELRDEPALILTLYGTVSNTDIINFPTADPSVRDVTWEQVASDRVRYTVHLRHAPFGYLVLWERGALVLRVRRPPAVNALNPLAGLVIAVDAGHPPIGATGPTGLYEGDAVLAVARRLQPLLEARGARVILTRESPAPVPLGDRPIVARRADADAFVSIHLNALPDGVNPYRENGTGTYFFNDHSEPLARAIQRGLVREMGLRDLGINYDNLAVVRPTWMPSVLCEGAFVILPDQEAALRSPEFQERYALGIVEGLEEYFRELGAGGRGK